MTGKILNVYNDLIHYHHQTYKSEAVFHSNNKHIIGGSENGSIVLWDIITAKVDLIIPITSSSASSNFDNRDNKNQSKAISSLSMHPMKPMIISYSYDGTAKIWDEENETIAS